MHTATGKVIKALRKHLGYKQEFLANKVNITIKTLANIENGRVGLDIEKLYKLSQVFGVAPRIILDLTIEIYETGQENWLPNAVKALKTLPKNNKLEED